MSKSLFALFALVLALLFSTSALAQTACAEWGPGSGLDGTRCYHAVAAWCVEWELQIVETRGGGTIRKQRCVSVSGHGGGYGSQGLSGQLLPHGDERGTYRPTAGSGRIRDLDESEEDFGIEDLDSPAPRRVAAPASATRPVQCGDRPTTSYEARAIREDCESLGIGVEPAPAPRPAPVAVPAPAPSSDLQARLEQSEARNATLTAELERVRASDSSREAKIAQLREEIARLQRLCDALKGENVEVLAERQIYQQRMIELAGEVGRLEEKSGK
ncbi:MAG: hypothetical protein WCT24_00165 [Patescibacteria group bacterium]|jgi:hypothetical protein